MPLKYDDSTKEFERIKRELDALGPKAAVVAERFFLKNFDLQGFQGSAGLEEWAKRNPDFTPGKKLLIQSGKLRQGINGSFNSGVVRVDVQGVAANYADYQNFGATITVTAGSKAHFWIMYYKTKSPFWKNMALKKIGSVIKIPARKFIGDSDALLKLLQAMFENGVKAT